MFSTRGKDFPNCIDTFGHILTHCFYSPAPAFLDHMVSSRWISLLPDLFEQRGNFSWSMLKGQVVSRNGFMRLNEDHGWEMGVEIKVFLEKEGSHQTSRNVENGDLFPHLVWSFLKSKFWVVCEMKYGSMQTRLNVVLSLKQKAAMVLYSPKL